MFGFSVALCGDGSRLAISEPFTSTGASPLASLYFYLPTTSGQFVNISAPVTLPTNATVIGGNSLAFGINNTDGAYMLAVGVLDMSPTGRGYIGIIDWSTNTPTGVSYGMVVDVPNCGQQVSVGDDYFAFTCGFPSSVSQDALASASSTVYVQALPRSLATTPPTTLKCDLGFAPENGKCVKFQGAGPSPAPERGAVVIPAAVVFSGVTLEAFQGGAKKTIDDLTNGILNSFMAAANVSTGIQVSVERITNAATGGVIWSLTGSRRLQTTINVRVDYSVIVTAAAAAANPSLAASVQTLAAPGNSAIAAAIKTNVAAAAAASGNSALAQAVLAATVTTVAPPSTTPAASSPSIVGPVVGGVIGGLAAIIIAVFAFRTLSAKKGDPSQFQGENPMPKRSQVVPA